MLALRITEISICGIYIWWYIYLHMWYICGSFKHSIHVHFCKNFKRYLKIQHSITTDLSVIMHQVPRLLLFHNVLTTIIMFTFLTIPVSLRLDS